MPAGEAGALTPGAELTLVPEKPVAGGSMLARHGGRVVLVRGAIPGEPARVRVERVGRGVAHAIVVDVPEPHPDRREALVEPACGGNTYAHVAYPRQLTLKAEVVADAFRRLARMTLDAPVTVAASPERGYRVRARLHVAGDRAGFFREGTHELCDPATSGQLRPESAAAVRALVARVGGAGADLADVHAIELAENVAGTECAVHLELSRAWPTEAYEGLRGSEGLTGVSWSSASDSRTRVLSGSPYVLDQLALASGEGIRLRRHVRAFFQANRYLVSDLVDAVASLVAPGPVVDLYAGVGLFAAGVAASRRGGDQVVAVEGDAVSAADLAVNVATSPVPCTAHHVSVEAFLRRSGDALAGSVVVDPPRTGLSREAAQRLLGRRPPRIVYVSCDVATLARDVRTLSADYEMTHIEAFDLFPNTPHVETVTVLDRRDLAGPRA